MIEKFWESKLIKWGLAFLILLTLTGVAGSALLFWKYQTVVRENLPSVVLSEPEISGPAPKMGEPFSVTAQVRIPWNKHPLAIQFEPKTPLQLVDTPAASRERFLWGQTVWKITAVLQAYRPGPVPDQTLVCPVSGSPASELTMTLAPFEVQAPPDPADRELAIAGEIREDSAQTGKWVLVLAIGSLIAAGAALWWFFRSRERALAERPMTPWAEALDAIRLLRDRVRGNQTSTDVSLAILTDIVRKYLERRFQLRAERQTTVEFLSELERNDSVLQAQDRSFLKKFLSAADLVKFARLPADPALFNDAAEHAEKLVEGTVPDPSKEEENT